MTDLYPFDASTEDRAFTRPPIARRSGTPPGAPDRPPTGTPVGPPTAQQIIGLADALPCQPWPRHLLPSPDWVAMAAAMAAPALKQPLILVGLWADTAQVHALLLDEATLRVLPVSTPVEAGRFPTLSHAASAAAWFERMIHDLWGHVADGAADPQPWLDHGLWPQSKPLSVRPGAPQQMQQPADPGLDAAMQLPLGPILGGIEEPAALRLTLAGPLVTMAEARLGFAHKGTLALIRGKAPRIAARFAARLAGECTVAHSMAFAAAAEQALGVAAPPRAVTLRIVMLELERIAGHLDTLAEVGRLADATAVHTLGLNLRETLVRASAAAFGHRLMMDCVVPGGLAADINQAGPQHILRSLNELTKNLPALHRLHSGGALAARLRGLGRVHQGMARLPGAGGVVGRASGRKFDARMLSGTYQALAPRMVVGQDGDAAARQLLRLSEIEESVRLVRVALETLPAGAVSVGLPQTSGEGIACTESLRGDVWHWMRLDHGQVAAFFPRDAGWPLWPLMEHVLEHAATDDVALLRASFALPASGMDL